MMKWREMGYFKKIGIRLIPSLPLIVLIVAAIVAVYHIKVYW